MEEGVFVAEEVAEGAALPVEVLEWDGVFVKEAGPVPDGVLETAVEALAVSEPVGVPDGVGGSVGVWETRAPNDSDAEEVDVPLVVLKGVTAPVGLLEGVTEDVGVPEPVTAGVKVELAVLVLVTVDERDTAGVLVGVRDGVGDALHAGHTGGKANGARATPRNTVRHCACASLVVTCSAVS